jgi:hypothetical protein
MADVVALAGIGATAGVSIAAQVIGLLTKRGDRHHESSLEFEKRNGEAKTQALVELILTVDRLLTTSQPNNDWRPQGIAQPAQLARQRTAALLLYDNSARYLLTAGVLAFASPKVRDKVGELDKLLADQFTTATTFNLMTLRDISKRKEAAMDGQQWGEASNEQRREVTQAETIGADATLDIPKLHKLCNEILDSAREDLRGQ